MSYFIHLSLLLASIKMINSNREISLPLLKCSWEKNIRCGTGREVWKLQCNKEGANWKLSLSCTGEEPSPGSECLKIKITTITKNDKKLCKRCSEAGTCNGDGNSADTGNCENNCEESCTMPATTQTLSVKSEGNCDIEITDVPVVPLKFFDEKKSWIKALQHCHNLNYSLVHITNQTVQEEVKKLLQCPSKLKAGVWVGLERSIFGTDLEWKWTSGSTAVYPGWTGNFPADSLNNHCGKLIWNTTSETIKLVDANCHDELPFICQENLYMEF